MAGENESVRRWRWIACLALNMFAGFGCSLLAQSPLWVSAYYAGYMQGTSTTYHLRASQIDFSAVTDIIHFALVPNSDGSLDDQTDRVTAANADSITRQAHAAGKKVLICVGGSSSESGFLGATGIANRTTFINNILSIVSSRNYDGVDIDWEPLTNSDTLQFEAFVTALRNAMKSTNPQLLLTAAASTEPSTFARLQDSFDQVNIMTYHLSGPYPGWVTWHNAPVYNGGVKFPNGTRYLPCADAMVDEFKAAGNPATKLGIGVDFYGVVWSGGSGTPTGGVTAPRQSWTVPPTIAYHPYYLLMDSLYLPQRYHWDDVPEAAYLSIDSTGSANDKFISYDDQTSCTDKVNYAHSKGIGGIIIWELGGGWRPGTAVPDTLLKAIGSAVRAVTSVVESPEGRPAGFALQQNYPNPFNPTTTIEYTIGGVVALSGVEGRAYTNVTLKVYDLLGREVATLVNDRRTAGSYTVRFDASTLASGLYFYRLQAGRFVISKKMILLK